MAPVELTIAWQRLRLKILWNLLLYGGAPDTPNVRCASNSAVVRRSERRLCQKSNSAIMKIYLCISIDCECDKGIGWVCRQPLSFSGVAEGLARRLHPLFLQYAAKPTYLLSAEVMRDEQSVNWLRKISNQAELGSHLHGEFVDPGAFIPVVTSAFQRDYSPEIEALKMANLTSLFTEAFGRPPRSFRAGRFGIGRFSLEILQNLGYRVDSSVTPHV